MKKLLLILLLMTTVAQAETYSWTDKDGTVNFSDSLGNVPASARSANTINPAASTTPRQRMDVLGTLPPQMEELKGRILKDEGAMALISSLQNDPELQALLRDPATLAAIQTMDISTLMGNPAVMKLLNNPQVRKIEKRMQQGGTK
jgi:hypothetical protein